MMSACWWRTSYTRAWILSDLDRWVSSFPMDVVSYECDWIVKLSAEDNYENFLGDLLDESEVLDWMVKQKEDESIEEIDRDELFKYIETKEFLAVIFCKWFQYKFVLGQCPITTVLSISSCSSQYKRRLIMLCSKITKILGLVYSCVFITDFIWSIAWIAALHSYLKTKVIWEKCTRGRTQCSAISFCG